MTADPLTAALDRGAPVVVLSPHLDDAVLSCGALMAHARPRVPVTVVTVFTAGSPPPYTLSGRRCLRLAGMRDARELYAARRAEDESVLSDMGVAWRHLGFSEGLFRVKPGRGGRVRRLLPERDHVYPTYRGHLTAGRISPHDDEVLRSITQTVTALAATAGPAPPLLLAPLAVGGHVDHLLLRQAAERSGRHAVYYSEFPYNRRHEPDAEFLRRNALGRPVTWSAGVRDKEPWILGYRTQARAMFPTGRVPLRPELYLCTGDPP
ncbi:PIG-L family deacetylase [Streptomyces sp. NPDC096205]|uniref:PIG-L family deacetylase n=1 Tax=Streptomyces sp. NPDC096205 TaxID=3366081 RepID=UPI0038132E97